MEFQAFPKIPRLSRECTVTEKLDGTNGIVCIAPVPKPSEGDPDWPSPAQPQRLAYWYGPDASMWGIWAGSRTRWIMPGDDNYGFARWVADNVEELKKLGPGYHYGEWWGAGIQRKYGIAEKRFSLFNVGRWNAGNIPACCNVVPTIYVGPFSTHIVDDCLAGLRLNGSAAAPGFMNPEGVMVYHHAAGAYFKKTLDNDDAPKGK